MVHKCIYQAFWLLSASSIWRPAELPLLFCTLRNRSRMNYAKVCGKPSPAFTMETCESLKIIQWMQLSTFPLTSIFAKTQTVCPTCLMTFTMNRMTDVHKKFSKASTIEVNSNQLLRVIDGYNCNKTRPIPTFDDALTKICAQDAKHRAQPRHQRLYIT